jgi:hypothetical protein
VVVDDRGTGDVDVDVNVGAPCVVVVTSDVGTLVAGTLGDNGSCAGTGAGRTST